MSKQWGHGFHQGKKAQVLDGLTRRKEYGIDRWINALRAGEVIFRRDWDSDSKRLFMRNGVLLMCEDGSTKPYEIDDADMLIEWFGFADFDDIEIEASNALAQADAACGVSPGAMGSAAQLRRTE